MYRLGVYLGRTLRINRFYALPVGKVGKAAGYICGLISYDQDMNGIYIITLQGISVDGREIRMQSEFVVGANH